jgi:hypothetical protein
LCICLEVKPGLTFSVKVWELIAYNFLFLRYRFNFAQLF